MGQFEAVRMEPTEEQCSTLCAIFEDARVLYNDVMIRVLMGLDADEPVDDVMKRLRLDSGLSMSSASYVATDARVAVMSARKGVVSPVERDMFKMVVFSEGSYGLGGTKVMLDGVKGWVRLERKIRMARRENELSNIYVRCVAGVFDLLCRR